MQHKTRACIFPSRRQLLFYLLILFPIAANAQLWQPLGPDPRRELGFGGYSRTEAFIHDDSIYVALPEGHAMIKGFNGTGWDTVGAAFNTNPNNTTIGFSRAVTMDSNKTPYVFFTDAQYPATGGYKGSVVRYTGGSWVAVGSPGFTTGAITAHAIRVDTTGVPYVLFTSANQPTVMKFNGTGWVNVGAPSFTTAGAGQPLLELDPSGTPYVAFIDLWNQDKATVMTLVNGSWVNVGGSGGVSPAGADYLSLALDTAGRPVISFGDDAQSGKLTVMRYNGSSWVNVGSPGISDFMVYQNDITVNASGAVSVIYVEGGFNTTARVKQYNGTAWTDVGAAAGPGNSGHLSIASLPNGAPLITQFNMMKQFDAGSWMNVGSYGFTGELTRRHSLSVDKSGVPYVAFKDTALGNKVSVMRYTGGNWTYAGMPGLSAGAASSDISLAIGRNDTPYVAYYDLMLQSVSIKKFDGTGWVNAGSGTNMPPAQATRLSLAADTSGILHLAFADGQSQNDIKVWKYAGGTWQPMGGGTGTVPGPSPAYLELRFSPSGNIPYLLSNEYLQVYNGGSWQVVGLSTWENSIAPPSLAFGAADTPIVAITRLFQASTQIYHERDVVRKFNGNAWQAIGANTWVHDRADAVVLATDSIGTPYLASKYNDSLSIAGWNGQEWAELSTPAYGWSKALKAKYYDMTTGENNQMVLTHSWTSDLPPHWGNGLYAWGAALNTTSSAPLVASPVFLCEDIPAPPLTASGQNLKWYTSPGGTGSTSAPVPVTSAPDTTTWYVTQTIGIWESPMDSITVIVLPKPAPMLTINGASATVSNGPFSAYQWYLDGVAVPGATTSTITATLSGEYRVLVTDSNGCTAMSGSFIYTTGIGTQAGPAPVRVYPNPAGEQLYIQAPQGTTMSLLSLEGRTLISGRDLQEINLDGFAAGMYLLKLSDPAGRQLYLHKIVKR